jgi:hypothetical protein
MDIILKQQAIDSLVAKGVLILEDVKLNKV